MLRAFGYAGVLIVSFFIALWLIDRHNDEHSALLGTAVTYEIAVEQQPEVCATARSVIQFKGQICQVNGEALSVIWNSLANTTNSQPSCGPQKLVRWYRKDADPAYNARFLGLAASDPNISRRCHPRLDRTLCEPPRINKPYRKLSPCRHPSYPTSPNIEPLSLPNW